MNNENIIGEYIAIEGMDGSGKSTQSKMLVSYLDSMGQPNIHVREPGGTPEGEAIRSILLDGSKERPELENFELFTEARKHLMEQKVSSALKLGMFVVSDRCWASSYAYQGQLVEKEYIVSRSNEVLGKYFMPKIVVIDIPADVAIERLDSESAKKDTYEKRDVSFFQGVRERYLEFAKRFNAGVVDGTHKPDDVHLQITDLLDLRG